MGFIEDAQAVVRGEAQSGAPPLPSWVDLDECRRVVWEEVARLPPERLREAHEFWRHEGGMEALLRGAASSLASGTASQLLGADRIRTLHATLRYLVSDLPPSDLAPLERLEVEAAALEARKAEVLWHAFIGWPSVVPWLKALGFLEEDGCATHLGRTFSRLRGRAALQFALEVGIQTSLGEDDELRLSREVLSWLEQGWTMGWRRPVVYTAGALGLVTLPIGASGGGVETHRIREGSRDLVQRVLSDEPNPIRTLVQSLLDAELGVIHAERSGETPGSYADPGYPRLVIHELNNALLPLGTALHRLWTALGTPGTPDPMQLAALRERIDRQVERLQRFASDAGRLLEAAAPSAFPLDPVVEEAIRETEPDRNGRIGVEVEASTVVIDGDRGRWLLCFVNLFRNSAQARAGKGKVHVSSAWDATGRLHLYVDDDGPGVPEELRERIFEQGVSHKGGTGLGLFEARTTVRLSGGSITCEESPLGGARFHIHVPARRSA